jgi:hypothetical protein
MRFSKYLFAFLPVFILISINGSAQQTNQEKRDVIKVLVGSKDFDFIAQSATTMKGNTIELTSVYGIKIMIDSISVDLPFFGTAYEANYGGSGGGIKLNTRQFNYKADSAKKGAWNIDITTTGNSKVKRIFMNVTPAGYCTVRVSTTDRQLISYYGRLSDNIGSH